MQDESYNVFLNLGETHAYRAPQHPGPQGHNPGSPPFRQFWLQPICFIRPFSRPRFRQYYISGHHHWTKAGNIYDECGLARGMGECMQPRISNLACKKCLPQRSSSQDPFPHSSLHPILSMVMHPATHLGLWT